MSNSLRITIGEEVRDITRDKEGSHASVQKVAEGVYLVRAGSRSIEVFEKQNGVFSDGNSLDDVALSVESQRDQIIRKRFGALTKSAAGGAEGSLIVRAPMPGLVRTLRVNEGDDVEKGTTLIVLEAMKMENNIAAPHPGKVTRIHVSSGGSVEKGAKLIEIERKQL